MKAVLFDLDGTLFDTLEDIRSAMNYALAAWDGTEASEDDVRRYIGRGLRRALALARAEHCRMEDDSEGELMFQLMCSYYRRHPYVHTAFYPGIPELLSSLKERGIRIGIVSNKADAIVQMIAERSGFPFDYAAGEKEGVPLKPDPAAVHQALSALGCSADETLFVGDSEVDAETGRNAGMRTLIVSWGFRSKEELLKSGIDRTYENAAQLLCTILESHDIIKQ